MRPHGLDTDHRHSFAVTDRSHECGSCDLVMSIEDRFTWDCEKRLIAHDDPVRLAAAEPEPASLVAIAHVAHAVRKNVARALLILARAVASGRLKYSRVTTGPETTNSPISSLATSRSSDQVAIGASSIRITSTSIPWTGRPTQTPKPMFVAPRVSTRISSLPIEATGNDSVAPYGVWIWAGGSSSRDKRSISAAEREPGGDDPPESRQTDAQRFCPFDQARAKSR